MQIFLGDDWAEDHHDVEVMDIPGRRPAKAHLPEGVAGMARLHTLVGELAGDADEVEVLVGIETDRGPWVRALVAAGYTVLAGRSRHGLPIRNRHITALNCRHRSGIGPRSPRGR